MSSPYLNRPVRDLDEYVMGLARKVRAALEDAGSGLGAVATGGSTANAWPEVTHGAASASSPEELK